MAKNFTFYDPLDKPVNVGETVTAGGSLVASKTYYYRILAVDHAGTSSVKSGSPLSDERSFTTTDTDKSVDITWDAVDGAVGYYVILADAPDEYNKYSKTVRKYTDTNSITITTTTAQFTYTPQTFAYSIVETYFDIENEGFRTVIMDGGTEEDPITFKDIYDACITQGWSADSVYWKSFGNLGRTTDDNQAGIFALAGQIIISSGFEIHFRFRSGWGTFLGPIQLGTTDVNSTFQLGKESQVTKHKKYHVTFLCLGGYNTLGRDQLFCVGKFYGFRLISTRDLVPDGVSQLDYLYCTYFGTYYRVREGPAAFPNLYRNVYMAHGGYHRLEGGFGGGIDDFSMSMNLMTWRNTGDFKKLRNIYYAGHIYAGSYSSSQSWQYVKLNNTPRTYQTGSGAYNAEIRMIMVYDLDYTVHLIDYIYPARDNIPRIYWSNVSNDYYARYAVYQHLTFRLKVVDKYGNAIPEATVVVTDNQNNEVLNTTTQADGEVGKYAGTVTSYSAPTLTFTGPSWDTDEWVDYEIVVLSGTGVGQRAYIDSNTADTLTIDRTFKLALDDTSKIVILPHFITKKHIYDTDHYPDNGIYTNTTEYMPWVVSITKAGYFSRTIKYITNRKREEIEMLDEIPVIQTASAKGSIKQIQSSIINSKARIYILPVQTIDVKANIKSLNEQSLLSSGNIKKTHIKLLEVKSRIHKSGVFWPTTQTLEVKANILQAGYRRISRIKVIDIVDMDDKMRTRAVPRVRPRVKEIMDYGRISRIKWITAKAKIQ